MWDCCRWLHHMKKTELASSASCSKKKTKRSCSDTRKKESGVVVGESAVRCDSSERQTLQTPAAAPSLSAAAAGGGAEDAAWSGLVLESREPQRSNSTSCNGKNKAPDLKGFFCWISASFPSVVIPLGDGRQEASRTFD